MQSREAEGKGKLRGINRKILLRVALRVIRAPPPWSDRLRPVFAQTRSYLSRNQIPSITRNVLDNFIEHN